MTEWKEGSGEKMTVGDVWWWQDAYFWRGTFMGHREIKAQCVRPAERMGFWVFEVRECRAGETLDSRFPVPAYKVGESIERAFATLLKSGGERREWSEDESGRSVRASKYVGDEEHERVMSTEGDAPARPVRPREVRARRGKRKKSKGSARAKPSRRGRPGIKLRP